MNLCFANREMLFFKKNLDKCSSYCIQAVEAGGNAILIIVSTKQIKPDEERNRARRTHRIGLVSHKKIPLHLPYALLRDSGIQKIDRYLEKGA